MKEYAVRPPEEDKRYELAPNLFMTVTLGGEVATIYVNGNRCIMNDCGRLVILINNQSNGAITIAGTIDGDQLLDSTQFPGESQPIVLSQGETSMLQPPISQFESYSGKILKVTGIINDEELQHTFHFKNSHQNVFIK